MSAWQGRQDCLGSGACFGRTNGHSHSAGIGRQHAIAQLGGSATREPRACYVRGRIMTAAGSDEPSGSCWLIITLATACSAGRRSDGQLSSWVSSTIMEPQMTKVVCVPLYHDPVDRYRIAHARNDLPATNPHPDGQMLSTAKAINFKPGMFGSLSGQPRPIKFSEGERCSGLHTWATRTDLRHSFGAWPVRRGARGRTSPAHFQAAS